LKFGQKTVDPAVAEISPTNSDLLSFVPPGNSNEWGAVEVDVRRLRAAARCVTLDQDSADDLAEETLKCAISEVRFRPANLTLYEWLRSIMERFER